MPLYEYECLKCGKRTEAIQRHGDALLKVCPNCGGKLKKLLSAPAFQFKGSGFYVTDYGKGGVKSGERAGEKAEKAEKAEEKGKKEISSKGEEAVGTGGGAPSGGEAGGGESKREDSSKVKKDGGSDAAPAAPAGGAPPAPSRKKSRDRK